MTAAASAQTVPEAVADMERRLAESCIPLDDLLREGGITKPTWWRWREGRYLPRMSKWAAVEKAFETLIERSGRPA